MKSEICSLFPTPIHISNYFLNIDDIINFCDSIEYRGNETNVQSVDTFVLENEIFYNLKIFIESKIKDYTKKVLGSDQKVSITQSWINKSPKGGQHKIHTHPNSLISGVFYLKLDSDMPQITFYKDFPSSFSLSSSIITEYTTDYFSLDVSKGNLVLFPSQLKHAVSMNKSEKDRISLSFNTFPANSFGHKDFLTFTPYNLNC